MFPFFSKFEKIKKKMYLYCYYYHYFNLVAISMTKNANRVKSQYSSGTHLASANVEATSYITKANMKVEKVKSYLK